MRVLFMGTGEIALPSFRMVADEHVTIGLVTQPDRPVGRSSKPRPPRIKELALEAGIPVLQPERVRRREALDEIAALAPDLIVVMAYGQILPKELLEMPPRACINVHASLLPRHRGASCLQAAIEAGDQESGVTIMHMAEGLDTGDIILQQRIPLLPAETGGSLHDRIAQLSPGCLREAVNAIREGSEERIPQDERFATYAPKLDRADGELDWSMPARHLERRIRANDPWPGTFTALPGEHGRPLRLKVFPPVAIAEGEGGSGELVAVDTDGISIACGGGALQLGEVQADGGRRLGMREFLAGHRLLVGDRFFSLERGRE